MGTACLVFGLLGLAVSWKGQGRVRGELFRYDFANKAGMSTPPAAGSAISVGNLTWASSDNITWNPPGEGNGLILGPGHSGLVSNQNGMTVQTALLANNAFTLEVWLESTTGSSTQTAIVGWSALTKSSTCADGSTGVSSLELQIWDEGTNFLTSAIKSTASECVIKSASYFGGAPTVPTLTHVLWGANYGLYGEYAVYINGVQQNTGESGIFKVDVGSLNLKVGGSLHPLQGKIYMVAMYDQYLNSTRALQNYHAWMLSSPPSSSDQTVAVTEDNIADLSSAIISSDFDEKAHSVMGFAGSEPKLVVVKSLPDKGSLYVGTDGNKQETLLTSVPTSPTPSGKKLFYLTPTDSPPANVLNYTSFRFAISDSEFESAEFTLTLDGITAPDGPRTYDYAITVIRGVPFSHIVKTEDPDADAAPTTFCMDFPVLPANGHLLRDKNDPKGLISDTSVVGKRCTTTACTTSSPSSPPPRQTNFAFFYVGNTNGSGSDAGVDLIGYDSFTYRTHDACTGGSIPTTIGGYFSPVDGRINVTIMNHVQSSDQIFDALEDANSNFTVAATDLMKSNSVSGSDTHVMSLIVLSLPANGELYRIDSGTLVTVNEVIPSLKLRYIAGPLNWYGNATFRFQIQVCSVAAVSCSGGTIWNSKNYTATLDVAPVDDAANLTYTIQAGQLNSLGLFELVISKTSFRYFNVSITDIDSAGALYSVRVKSQAGDDGKGSVLFDAPDEIKTGVSLKNNLSKRSGLQVFGGTYEQISAALTNFKAYGNSAGKPFIVVEVTAVPLVDWISSNIATSMVLIPAQVVSGAEDYGFSEWERYAIYGGAAAALVLSFVCCWCCARRCQQQGEKRGEKNYIKKHPEAAQMAAPQHKTPHRKASHPKDEHGDDGLDRM
eukprot:gb/GEZN01001734.1/.p1 GENE.gb/GEZN01001734.1/~~gb/GEZN01001734.1/.p1  ORF type:complete len:891 (+),score=100.63 gb/GEZN01001734.1/:27-2699(+)